MKRLIVGLNTKNLKLGKFKLLSLDSKLKIEIEHVLLHHFFLRCSELGIRMRGIVMADQQMLDTSDRGKL